jgi:acyl transferase domain-containing protein/NADPH:quinone reductase-like Zn-dependent oxidoreductase/acyl carrier protein
MVSRKQKMQETILASSPDRQAVAIIGMGCRYPGTPDTHSFWQRLKDGKSSIQEIPIHRFGPVDDIYDPRPAIPGRIMSRYGGFLEDIERFDAEFFGISPLEACQLDPQQRLLLEVAWEALEDAGLPAERLVGSETGVFVGSWLHDFETRLIGDPLVDDRRRIDLYTTTGSGRYPLAGRLSYFFGFQGPSLVVDTACSSSLVAIHLACRSLRQGECGTALAGGVNVILTPYITLAYSQSRMMAPDGRCKFGDAAANGYVRSEGCGLLVLKDLSKALADGDFIHAVIHGSAVNNDGSSCGYMATPCKEGQMDLLRKAYRDAGISPNMVKYIEAHGTGTSAGDPVELRALGEVLSQDRAHHTPCLVGSIKTNLGHTEGAAGVAGVIKTALAIRNRQIPASLNFTTPNPKFSWDTYPLKIPTRTSPWPSGDGPLIAGVSGFGIAGTNAHIVLGEAPVSPLATGVRSLPEGQVDNRWILPISAHCVQGLRQMAAKLHSWCAAAGEEIPLDDLCATAARRREHLEYRAAIVAGTSGQLQERLRAFAGGETPEGVIFRDERIRPEGKLAFVYSGQGSQWLGMCRDLMAHSAVFRKTLLRCDKALEPFVDWSPMGQLEASENDSRLHHTNVLQPLLFAVHVALTAQWRAWGVTPDAVVGHSMGEPAAAHAAGVLDLESAAKIIALRSRLMKRAGGRGAMALVELSTAEAASEIRGYGEKLVIAGSNSPRATVVSGDPAVLEAFLGVLERRRVFCRKLNMNVACHSPQMGPLRGELVDGLAGLAPQPATVPIYSTVYGAPMDGNAFDAGYWGDNLRQPVKFAQTIDGMLKDGHTVFIEISPHPVLLRAIDECALADNLGTGRPCITLPSLVRGQDEPATILESLGAVYNLGHSFDWHGLYGRPLRRVTLPTYPWQRERHWFEEKLGQARSRRLSKGRVDGRRRHVLLEHHINSSVHNDLHLWQSELNMARLPWLEEHKVQNRMVFPAAAFIEAAAAAAEEALNSPVELREIDFSEALIFDGNASKQLQIAISKESGDKWDLRISSQATDTRGDRKIWHRHVRGLVIGADNRQAAPLIDMAAVCANCDRVVEGGRHYAAMNRLKIGYGPAFQGIQQIDLGRTEAVAAITSPREIAADAPDFRIHPALLDTGLQLLVNMASSRDTVIRPGVWLPVRVEKVRLFPSRTVPDELRAVCKVSQADGRQEDLYSGDFYLLDPDGRVLADLSGVVLKRIAHTLGQDVDPLLFEMAWQSKPFSKDICDDDGQRMLVGQEEKSRKAAPLPKTAADAQGSPDPGPDKAGWLIFADRSGLGEGVADRLGCRGDDCRLVYQDGDQLTDSGNWGGSGSLDTIFYDQLIGELADFGRQGVQSVVYLWPLDGSNGAPSSVEDLHSAQKKLCASLLALTQAMVRNENKQRLKLWVVTQNAVPTGETGEALSLKAAALAGLVKVIDLEHPELECRLVDLNGDQEMNSRYLFEELTNGSGESITACRGNQRFVPRMVSCGREHRGNGDWFQIPEGDAARLVCESRGTLDGLRLHTIPQSMPEPGNVAVQVRATGLNFRDVVSALGMIEDDSDPGLECAGLIVGVGQGVGGLCVGDEVIAAAPGAFATIVHANAALVLPKPEGLTFEQAATIPIAFLTAWHALVELAELKEGERLLIHAASGGVGMAAVQVAKMRGAVVFGSAGTPRKRAVLTSMGVDHVLDSRSLDFASRVEEITAGRGVHVVLNSLSGDYIDKSFEVLRQGGRFIEIGKQNIWSHEKVRRQRPDAFYRFFDLAGMIADQPQRVGAMLDQLLEKFRAGELKPLPATIWPMEQIGRAYRTMQQAAHMGKIVLNLPPWCGSRSINAPDAFRNNATYMVTGAFGGIGLRLVKWLFKRGARHFVLIGRNLPDAPHVADIEDRGAHVVTAACDIAVFDQVERLFTGTLTRMPPLRGVFHLAGTLDDGAILQQDWSRFEKVFAPKVLGGWNLHRMTRHMTLDCFVLFSSWAAVLGSQGQANYCAANTFLDALAWQRRAAGLPGLSINWGAWAEIGMAARGDGVEKLSRHGIGSFPPEIGFLSMGRLMSQGRVQATVTPFDLRKWRQTGRAAERSTWFEVMDESTDADAQSQDAVEPTEDLAQRLQTAPYGEPRQILMESFLKKQVAWTLRLPKTRIDSDKPFKSFGMDSLTALEFRNRIETGTGVTLSATLVWNYPTINKLVPFLFEKIGIPIHQEKDTVQSSVPPDDGDDALLGLLDEIENLPEDEVRQLLKDQK